MSEPRIRFRKGRCRTCGQEVDEIDGAALRQIREAAGLSLRRLAERCGWSAAYVSDVELNRRRATPRVVAVYRGLLAQKVNEALSRCRRRGEPLTGEDMDELASWKR